MNKNAKTTTWLSAFMALVVLTSSIYILIPDKVKIVVEKTNTKFYVYEEGWVLGATEYFYLYDGTKKMRASYREVNTSTEGDITIITRLAKYKDNIETFQTYTFDSTIEDIELIPISHEAECINCRGKIVHFEYRDITYDGITQFVESPQEYGHQMKIEWQYGNYYSKVFQQKYASDKMIIRYRPTTDYETYLIRMFDPEKPKPTDCINMNVSYIEEEPIHEWVNYTIPCLSPLMLNYTIKPKIAYCWKWNAPSIVNGTPGFYYEFYNREYYDIINNDTILFRDKQRVGWYNETKYKTECVKQGWVNNSGTIIAYEDFWGELCTNKIATFAHIKDGGRDKIIQAIDSEGDETCCVPESGVTCFEENLETKKTKFYNSMHSKLKKKEVK